MNRTPKHRKVLGQSIRAHRKAANLTQEQLAEKADLHPNYLGEVERGEKAITIDSLIKIASALKVHVSQFLAEL